MITSILNDYFNNNNNNNNNVMALLLSTDHVKTNC